MRANEGSSQAEAPSFIESRYRKLGPLGKRRTRADHAGSQPESPRIRVLGDGERQTPFCLPTIGSPASVALSRFRRGVLHAGADLHDWRRRSRRQLRKIIEKLLEEGLALPAPEKLLNEVGGELLPAYSR